MKKYYRKRSGVYVALEDSIPVSATFVEVTKAEYDLKPVSPGSASTAVQAFMDKKAKEFGYDSILSACSYAAYPNTYQAEAQKFIVWRAACWDKCYAILAAVQRGQKYNLSWTAAIPTEAELLAELPVP